MIDSDGEQPRPLVLYVDDDAANRQAMAQCLRMDGMEALEADSFAAALEIIVIRRPPVALVGVASAGGDGRYISRLIKTSGPKIIDTEVSAAAFAGGPARDAPSADCSLVKPVEPLELVAVTRAMLRLHGAEAKAHTEGERYRMIVESAIDYAIFTCGLDGRVTSWNAGAEAILGYTAEQIIGEHCTRIFMADDVASAVPEAEMQAAQAGAGVRFERWHRRRDGTRFWSSGRMVLLRDRSGQPAGYLEILYDRSIEKSARDTLVALNSDLESRVAERTKELVAANEALRVQIAERAQIEDQVHQLQKMEALGQLTGGIAHDFNNLLTAILGGLEVTRRRVEDPRTLRLVDSSMNAAQRGVKLIAQLMAFARRQHLRVEHLSLNALVEDMKDLLERSVGAAVVLTLDLAPDLWPVMADASQVQTALLNLAGNARDAMPDGGELRIGTANASVGGKPGDGELAPGDYATLTLQDNGTGMSDTVKARLFEPFFTTKDVGRGTGLGLSQVYGFVRQSGGDVRVRSAIGEGTQISILLPRAEAREEETVTD